MEVIRLPSRGKASPSHLLVLGLGGAWRGGLGPVVPHRPLRIIWFSNQKMDTFTFRVVIGIAYE